MRNAATTGATRREFLVRSAATAGGAFLSIGLPALLPGSRAEAASSAAMTSFTPSIWFTLTPDGKVTMHIVKAEMGQHIGTALAQVIAEELAVRWQDVHLDTPLESVDNFAIYGLAYTVNSGSVTTEFDRLSRAGAARPYGPHRSRRQAARRRTGWLPRREQPCHRYGIRTLHRLRRDHPHGQDRPQVRLSARLQRRQAEGTSQLHNRRPIAAGARHSGQDQRSGEIRHRRVFCRHGLWRGCSSAHPLCVEGRQRRRFRGAARSPVS